MAKTTIADILDKKRRGEKITQVTAYDYPVAQLARAREQFPEDYDGNRLKKRLS